MSERRELGKFGQFVVTAMMVGGFAWLCKWAWDSDSLWPKLVMGFFVFMFACMGGFVAMMMGSQWWHERRKKHDGRD